MEPVLKGEIHLFGNEESPFRKSVKDHLAKGAESQNSSQSLMRLHTVSPERLERKICITNF